jgi:dynein light intermediate chain
MEHEDPQETLLQYEPPQEVSGDIVPATRKKVIGPTGRKKGNLPPLEAKPSSEDILHAILPPREWEENGRKYL